MVVSTHASFGESKKLKTNKFIDFSLLPNFENSVIMSKVTNVNSSLAYEILLYLNSFYLGMFIVCEVAIGILKACNASYPENALMTEAGIFGLLCLVDVIRIFLGRKGNLVNRKIPVFFSILLTVPSSIGVCYFLIYQTYILRLEYIWCAVMLMFQALELAFAVLYMVTVCKNNQCA